MRHLGSDDEQDERYGFGNSDFVKAAHFGGGANASTEQERRTKLEEAIAKSKLARLDRKEQKQEDEALLNQLDTDFNALRGMIFASASKAAPAEPPRQPAQYEDYEKQMKALSNEPRSAPSDRLKTDQARRTTAPRSLVSPPARARTAR